MARQYREPSVYRDKKCPHCGFYFTARGLTGHLRFKHSDEQKDDVTKFLMKVETLKVMKNQGMHLTQEQRETLLDMFLLKQLREGKL